MSLRASSRSVCVAGSSASPHFTAAALIRCTAAVVITSTAGTSAMSRVGQLVEESVASLARVRRRAESSGVGARVLSPRRVAPPCSALLRCCGSGHRPASKWSDPTCAPASPGCTGQCALPLRKIRGASGCENGTASPCRRGIPLPARRLMSRNARRVRAHHPRLSGAAHQRSPYQRQDPRPGGPTRRPGRRAGRRRPHRDGPQSSRRRPISTSSRSPRTRARRWSRSWTTGSSSTRRRRRPRRRGATRRTRS